MLWLEKYYDGGNDPGKMYPSWRKNADFVNQHNAEGHSYTVSLNKFAHLTPKDLLKEKIRSPTAEEDPEMTLPASPLPPSVDWRTKGVVPPVRNQGQCGSSVSFALVGAIDAFHAIRTKQLVLGSEEEFRECCATPPCSCDGEIVSGDAYKCVVEIGGLATEGSYPPPSTSCKCRNDTVAPAIKIDGGRDVSPSRNETALEAAVAMQPVFALIDASHASFQLYTAGIYNEPSCSQSNLDLAVLIVGYGSEGKEDYWIVQNSWGTSWGMEGYILMSRNKNNQCGIATAASYPY
eukprot:Em0020g951a